MGTVRQAHNPLTGLFAGHGITEMIQLQNLHKVGDSPRPERKAHKLLITQVTDRTLHFSISSMRRGRP